MEWYRIIALVMLAPCVIGLGVAMWMLFSEGWMEFNEERKRRKLSKTEEERMTKKELIAENERLKESKRVLDEIANHWSREYWGLVRERDDEKRKKETGNALSWSEITKLYDYGRVVCCDNAESSIKKIEPEPILTAEEATVLAAHGKDSRDWKDYQNQMDRAKNAIRYAIEDGKNSTWCLGDDFGDLAKDKIRTLGYRIGYEKNEDCMEFGIHIYW